MTKCFYCDKEAVYDDVVIDKQTYEIASVCKQHFSLSFVS